MSSPFRREQAAVAAGLIVAGAASAAAAYVAVSRGETARGRATFDKRIERVAVALERQVSGDAEHLYAIRSLFEADEGMTRGAFEVFARGALLRRPSLQALEWVPRILDAEREAHEALMRDEGLPGYRITDRTGAGEPRPAERRAEYFPVCYVMPHEGNEAAVGFDLASDRVRGEALDRAALTGRLVLTASIALIQETEGSRGMLGVVPLYEGRPTTDEGRRVALRGFAVGVVRFDAILAESIAPVFSPAEISDIVIELLDETRPTMPILLTSSVERAGLVRADLPSKEVALEIGDRRWRLVGLPSESTLAEHRSDFPLVAALAAFLLVQLVGGLVFSMIRRVRERAVERERTVLGSALKSLAEGVVVADHAGKILHVNEAARRLIGKVDTDVPPSEWSRKFGIFRPDGTTPFPSGELPLARAIRGDEIIDDEVFVRNENILEGVWLNVSGGPLRDEEGARRGGVIVFRDVTERKKGLALQERLFNAVEQTEDAVFITNRDGRIEYVNRGFEMSTGFAREEVLGETPRMLRSGRHDPGHYEAFWKTILRGEVYRGLTINRRKDGSLYYADQTVTPMRGASGEVTHFVSVCKDMTERMRLEEQDAEMHVASGIQRNLFPRQSLRHEGIDLAGAVFPAAKTCGDYFDYFALPGDTLGIAVGDVSGHGVGPALVMAETRAYLRVLARATRDLGSVFETINGALFSDLEDNRFVTLILARVDIPGRTVEYVNAGHPPGYVLDVEGRVKAVLRSSGLPLGMFADRGYQCDGAIPLEPGELLVLLTDGVSESECPRGTPFGTERVLAAVREHRNEPVNKIIDRLHDAIRTFRKFEAQQDDITIVVCRLGEARARQP